MRSDVRRYNAAVRRANNLAGKGSSQLIHIETVSEIERYTMAKDADRLVAFNKDVQKWMNSVAAELRASISSHSMRVATDLRPRMYTDKYGLINKLGFSFPRHGIYIHKGAGKGYDVSTGIVRQTNPESLNGSQGTGNRKAYEWFDPIVRNRIPELETIITNYFDSMIIDATRIYINK